MDLEQYLMLPVLAAITIGIVVAGVWLFMRSTEKKTFPIAVMLIGFCIETLFVRQPYITIGLQIYPNDAISLFLAASVAGSLLSRRIPVNDGVFLAWLAFGAMAVLSFIIGLGEFGRYAGTEFRPFFYIWVAGLYGCVADFDENDLRRMGRWCVWTCYGLIGIALFLIIGIRIGFVSQGDMLDRIVDGAVFRPIGSHATFFIAVVGLVQLMAWLRRTGTRYTGFHALVLLLVVVLMQHRSVWVAALFGFLMVLVMERRNVPERLPLVGWSLLLVSPVVAIAAWAGLFDNLIEDLVRSSVTMFDSQGTFAARVDGWDRLIETWTSASNGAIAIGLPFGYGYTRLFRGQLIEFAPHNWFLDLVLRVGVVGLIFYTAAALLSMFKALRAPTHSEFEVLMLRGLGVGLATSLLYYLAYPSYYIIGAAIGVTAGYLARRQMLRAAPAAPAAQAPVMPTVTAPTRRSPWKRDAMRNAR